jgi:hypothetical protein
MTMEFTSQLLPYSTFEREYKRYATGSAALGPARPDSGDSKQQGGHRELSPGSCRGDPLDEPRLAVGAGANAEQRLPALHGAKVIHAYSAGQRRNNGGGASR